jgi:hypothetical protein
MDNSPALKNTITTAETQRYTETLPCSGPSERGDSVTEMCPYHFFIARAGMMRGMIPEHPEPKPPFRFRKLRIGLSALWGTVALLLLVLWFLSYAETDYLQGSLPKDKQFTIASMYGRIFAAIYKGSPEATTGIIRNDVADEQTIRDNRIDAPFGFGHRTFPKGQQIILPY